MTFSCLSILFGFIVSGLSWAGYTDCDHYYSEYESHEDGTYIVGDCTRPASQLALMIANIVAIVISSFVVALVSNPLCCANQSATQNLHSSTIRISTIDMPADTPDLSTGTRTVVMRTRIVKLVQLTANMSKILNFISKDFVYGHPPLFLSPTGNGNIIPIGFIFSTPGRRRKTSSLFHCCGRI
jgi:hypothetical protein